MRVKVTTSNLPNDPSYLYASYSPFMAIIVDLLGEPSVREVMVELEDPEGPYLMRYERA
jgi:hypothetical protein